MIVSLPFRDGVAYTKKSMNIKWTKTQNISQLTG